MPNDPANTTGRDNDKKLLVGWQKLTKQELVEALTTALLDKVRRLRGDDPEVRTRAHVAGADSAD